MIIDFLMFTYLVGVAILIILTVVYELWFTSDENESMVNRFDELVLTIMCIVFWPLIALLLGYSHIMDEDV